MPIAGSGTIVKLGPNAATLLRIREQFDSTSDETIATAIRQLTEGGISTDGTTPRILSSTSGAPTIVNSGGRWLVRLTSAAARVVRNDGGRFPAEQQFSGAVIPPTALGRSLLRYSFQVPVRVNAQGTAEIEVGICDTNGMLTMLGTDRAYVWTSQAARNAGRWTPRFRQTAAGAITTLGDSGVAPTAWHLLGIRYTEGIPPRIEFMLDNVPRFMLEGDANMPTINAVALSLAGGYGVGAPAGSEIDFSSAVYDVQYIG